MNSTLNATQLLMVPLAPLLGSVLAGILGTALGGRRIGRGVSHSVTILGVFISLVISAMTLYSAAMAVPETSPIAPAFQAMVAGAITPSGSRHLVVVRLSIIPAPRLERAA